LNPASPEAPARRVQRVRHELVRRSLRVLRVETLGPHLRRIVFGDPSLASFVSPSFDDHVKLFLDQADGPPVMRDYTPRSIDTTACELTIDFVLHGDGPAAAWARQAQPGQAVEIAGPRGSFLVPTDFDWHLLVGDDTAWPAIARRLEELPAEARVQLVLLGEGVAANPSFRPELPTAAQASIHWADDADAVLAFLRGWSLPAGEGYVWCAGEAALMAAVRQLLVQDKQHNPRLIRAAAYWRRGSEGHSENLEA
jgi:NADPH-dependent ferric siderophore reductase